MDRKQYKPGPCTTGLSVVEDAHARFPPVHMGRQPCFYRAKQDVWCVSVDRKEHKPDPRTTAPSVVEDAHATFPPVHMGRQPCF